MPEIIFLKSWEKYRKPKELMKTRLERALNYFPELSNETIYVGLLEERDYAIARADLMNFIIKFKDPEPSYTTIFHELMHLAVAKVNENGKKLPQTEEFCSIAAMARMPPDLVDGDYIPYLGKPKIPMKYIPGLSKAALKYRQRRRDYIRWLKEKAGINIWGEPSEEVKQRLLSDVILMIKESDPEVLS